MPGIGAETERLAGQIPNRRFVAHADARDRGVVGQVVNGHVGRRRG